MFFDYLINYYCFLSLRNLRSFRNYAFLKGLYSLPVPS